MRWAALFLSLLAACGGGEDHPLDAPHTAVSFNLLGDPKNLVFVLTTDREGWRSNTTVVPSLLANGFGVATLDLPCHENPTPNLSLGLDCWRDRLNAGEDIFGQFATSVSSIITSLRPNTVTVMGISRGAYAGAIAASKDARITRVIGIAPVTDLSKLKNFSGNGQDLSLYYPALSSKRIFIAISEVDLDVDTDAARRFVQAVNADLTIIPGIGHSTFDHGVAVQWLVADFM
jgi:hypothetical protein